MFHNEHSVRAQSQPRRSERLRATAFRAGVAKPTPPRSAAASISSQESEAILNAALKGRSGTKRLPGTKPALKTPSTHGMGGRATPPPSPSRSPSSDRPPRRYPNITCFRHKQHGTHIIRIEQCRNPSLRTSVFTGAQGQRVVRIERLPLEPGAGIRAPPDPLAERSSVPRSTGRRLEHFMEGDRHFIRVQLGST
ncbi:hypothetical protein MAPG_05648 [Magnaporthiopsis poae ATCC 64411]|uniref:Uncharacterized protein n=1 Tax=Magnaporthiopsis poae (strain ATCC 64411 / 73-15) TaxID=644358 RepID=A0A0C4DZY5_MAGP6|nr:hypothetical protein MAPG_05648 [Magnaporthiopsis poae ATCC 64411]